MREGGPGLVEVEVGVESGPSHLFVRSSNDNGQTVKFHQLER